MATPGAPARRSPAGVSLMHPDDKRGTMLRTPIDADDEIEAIFLAEARRRMADVTRILQKGFPESGTRELTELARHAHTLKGTAGSLGHASIEVAAEEIMLRLEPWRQAKGPVPVEEATRLREDFREIAEEISAIEWAVAGDRPGQP